MSSTESIRELCADVLGKAEGYKKAFEFHTEPLPGAVEFWQNYRKRLATYDISFNYPGTVNPVKCAIKGWTYLGEGKIQCVECKQELQLNCSDIETEEDAVKTSLNILKNLRSAHDPLCSFHAAFHHSIILHSVSDLMSLIKANVPEQFYKSEEIGDELVNLGHIATITPSFALYFAVAGWFVKKDKTLFCKLCLKNVNPTDHKDSIMDPLKLHYDYCPILETYPQWRLALEEYVYANSNPKSISENFALIQRQLSKTGLLTKTSAYEFTRENEPELEMSYEITAVDPTRTLESIHETQPQSFDVLEQPQQLRDTDFEEQIQQESLNRKRLHERIDEEDTLPAKRSYLPFPHNYLAEYNQTTDDVVPFETADQNQAELEPSPISEILSPDMNEGDEEEEQIQEEVETKGHEILDEQDLDRLPVNEAGERTYEDSEDAQSAQAESYNDDDASTISDPVDENAPYNEPNEFEDENFDEDEAQQADAAAESDYDEDEGIEDDNNSEYGSADDDSDSDIIVLD